MTSGTEAGQLAHWQHQLLERHQLGSDFLATARQWFDPLVQALVQQHARAGRPILVGINGCQGSGKTTVSDYMCAALTEQHQVQAVALSLDDFYLTRAERQALAAQVHPLFTTRGVPGTHDMPLLQQTLAQLLEAQRTEPVTIPRFEKAIDDRRPRGEWPVIASPVEIVLLEGWCLGAKPHADAAISGPCNALERNEDASGVWRSYSNDILARDFLPLYSLVDQWLMLRAPSFDCVFNWRREQEQKLATRLLPEQDSQLMDDDALRRFIQHYERITRHCLEELPQHVNHLFNLDERRQIASYSQPMPAAIGASMRD